MSDRAVPPTLAVVSSPEEGAAAIAEGDRIALFEAESGRTWLLEAVPGARKERGLGIVDPGRFIGVAWGAVVDVAGKRLHAFRPDLPDLVATLRRKAAMILPKDAAAILHGLGIGPGDRVFESGVGTGASCIAFAHAVGGHGRVVVQELREDFVEWAMANVERAGLADRVEAHVGDLTQTLAPALAGDRFRAALLDQPQPWLAIPRLLPVLEPGARLCCFCPQVSQMEKVVAAMTDVGFIDIHCTEIIERSWLVREHGSRPDHNGLMHTAFLVFGRWPGAA